MPAQAAGQLRFVSLDHVAREIGWQKYREQDLAHGLQQGLFDHALQLADIAARSTGTGDPSLPGRLRRPFAQFQLRRRSI